MAKRTDTTNGKDYQFHKKVLSDDLPPVTEKVNDLLKVDCSKIVKYEKLAERIKNAELDNLICSQKIAEIKSEIEKWIATEMAEISAELNSDNKPLYSNSDKREAALTLRKEDSELYNSLTDELKKLISVRDNSYININYLKNLFSLYIL
jgi:hypothetical protein